MLPSVNFSCVLRFRAACMGNLCFGKCSVLHCSLWAVQTIYFPYHSTECSIAAEINLYEPLAGFHLGGGGERGQLPPGYFVPPPLGLKC